MAEGSRTPQPLGTGAAPAFSQVRNGPVSVAGSTIAGGMGRMVSCTRSAASAATL